MKIVLNINIRSVLIFDRNLIGDDEVVRSSSFSTCRHDCGRDCRSAILRGDHHCDVVWWSTWSVVDVVGARRCRSTYVQSICFIRRCTFLPDACVQASLGSLHGGVDAST